MDLGYTASTPVSASGLQTALPLTGCGYCGFVANAAAAGVVEIRDGSVTGTLLDVVSFAAAGIAQTFYGAAPLWVNKQVYVNLVSGALPAGFAIRWR
jgi:hypothetical protein